MIFLNWKTEVIYQDDSNLSKLLVTSNSIFIGGANKVVKLLKQGEKWEKVQTRNIAIDKNHPPIHPCCISKNDQERAWILKIRKTFFTMSKSEFFRMNYQWTWRFLAYLFRKKIKKKTQFRIFEFGSKYVSNESSWFTESETGFWFEIGQKILKILKF